MIRTAILGLGSYVPDRVVTNDELRFLDDKHERQAEPTINTDDAWIQQRTGIRERRYVTPGVATSDLAAEAAKRALADAGCAATDIDCIIVGTLSPDIFFPGVGVFLQRKLGIADKTSCPCYDIRQQCSAFLYGLQMADAFIRTGSSTCWSARSWPLARFHHARLRRQGLFGDGAGAAGSARSRPTTKRGHPLPLPGCGAGAVVFEGLRDREAPYVYYDANAAKQGRSSTPR
jgi:3-oxoacyl-[acyl-carrier-protein] synthase-3